MLDREEAVARDQETAEAITHAWRVTFGSAMVSAWRWRIDGRHDGEPLGLASTGNAIDITGAPVDNGRITALQQSCADDCSSLRASAI